VFNKTIINKGPDRISVNTTTTVHEHRAPTDKSVELLNEFQEKAASNLHSKYLVDNVLNAQIFVYTPSMMEFKMKLFFSFKLNGKNYEFEDSMDMHKFKMMTHKGTLDMEIYRRLYQNMAQTIAAELCNNVKSLQEHEGLK